MTIHAARVDWREGLGNSPRLHVLMDNLPSPEDDVFDVHDLDNRIVYVAEHEEIFRYFVHNPRDESGYGGSKFKLRLKNGEVREIKGPWSGNPMMLPGLGYEAGVDCQAHTKTLERGGIYCTLKLSVAEKAIKDHVPGMTLYPYRFRNDPMSRALWVPARKVRNVFGTLEVPEPKNEGWWGYAWINSHGLPASKFFETLESACSGLFAHKNQALGLMLASRHDGKWSPLTPKEKRESHALLERQIVAGL